MEYRKINIESHQFIFLKSNSKLAMGIGIGIVSLSKGLKVESFQGSGISSTLLALRAVNDLSIYSEISFSSLGWGSRLF